MNIANTYEEMVDFYHDNPAMMALYNYRHTELYQEIVLFLNDLNADWRKNKELGEYAADFILRIIQAFEQEPNNHTFVEWLHAIYEEIADRYSTTKSNYQLSRSSQTDLHALLEVYTTEDDFLEEAFEQAYEKSKKEDDEKVYLSF